MTILAESGQCRAPRIDSAMRSAMSLQKAEYSERVRSKKEESVRMRGVGGRGGGDSTNGVSPSGTEDPPRVDGSLRSLA